jgi:hypothetical protein
MAFLSTLTAPTQEGPRATLTGISPSVTPCCNEGQAATGPNPTYCLAQKGGKPQKDRRSRCPAPSVHRVLPTHPG